MNDNSKRLAMAIVLSVIVTVMYMNMFVPKPIVNNQNLNNVPFQVLAYIDSLFLYYKHIVILNFGIESQKVL